MTDRHLTRQERRAINAEWRKVPYKTRLDVLRLAKQGRPHTDATTDAAAARFAHAVLDQPSFLYTTAFQLLLSFGLLTIALLADDTFPRWCAGLGGGLCLILTIISWDLKRDARKILAVRR